MREKTLDLPPSTSTSPLFGSVCSQRHGTRYALVLARLGTGFRDSVLDERHTFSQDILLKKIKRQLTASHVLQAFTQAGGPLTPMSLGWSYDREWSS